VGPQPACIAAAVVAYQAPSGVFPAFWYPERLHVHYHALRALHGYVAAGGADDAPAREALRRGVAYRLEAQQPDGGWSTPSNAFDTAYALLALRAFGEGSDRTQAIARGRDFLLRTQLEDGSW